MKATGIVKKVDVLGRIVLPVELRRTLGFHLRDMLEISVDDDCVVLEKYEPHCVFCGETRQMITYRDKIVCVNCAKELEKMVARR